MMRAKHSPPLGGASEVLELKADVLVLGGGPAGTWAGWRAAVGGATVVLVDKGYCGSSGATASGGTGVWYVAPHREAREAAMASREKMGGLLADRGWMGRVLDQTYDTMNQLADWGYPFPLDEAAQPYRKSLQGPEYMRLMRRRIQKAGVTILDQSPALELIVDASGAVVGAAGIQRQSGHRWQVRSGAVVIATGGCAFLSKALGCNVLTGDGYLLAAEAGGEMSGMEFSNAYAIAPAFASVTKTLFYNWATFTYEDGRVIEGAGSQRGRSMIATTLLTQPVYAQLDKASPELQVSMRAAQPNFFLPFDRLGIDPFRQRFPVTLRLEGTVRGTGGIRIVDEGCATSVPGLYAAGDAATRELICGGFTGGGSHNAAWAMSSGQWAGQAAACYALARGIPDGAVESIGGAALRPHQDIDRDLQVEELIKAVQAEVFPYDYNYFRTQSGLTASLSRLNSLWQQVRNGFNPDPTALGRGREVAAMIATARWMYASALQRTESRGMHKHLDYPEQDPSQQHRLLSGGLDHLWIKPETQLANSLEAL
ncbi:MAG: FAD-binding protein [Cyanobacteriota bacterium]|nr:FAD-binding protein [Cyanobacteriota bacterium]